LARVQTPGSVASVWIEAFNATRHRRSGLKSEPAWMGWPASFVLLADAISSVETFINVFLGLYGLVIIVYIIASFLRLPYSPTLNRIQRFLYDVCEPYIRLFRRILPAAGAFDFSPVLALIFLGVIDRFLIWVLEHFH
jgi:YggT family protein